MEFPRVLAVAPLMRLQLRARCCASRCAGVSTRCFGQVSLWAPLAFLVLLCAFASAESLRPARITSLKVDVLQDRVLVRIEADRELVDANHRSDPSGPHRAGRCGDNVQSRKARHSSQRRPGEVGAYRALAIQTVELQESSVETSMPVTYTYRTERNSAILDIALQPAAPAHDGHRREASGLPPQVTYAHGLLTIVADHSSLAEILEAVRSRTGATTDFPAAAASELGHGQARSSAPGERTGCPVAGIPFRLCDRWIGK